MSARVLFVAGAHTEIGKTHVASGLLTAARRRGWRTDALKPVVSGFEQHAVALSDPGRLLVAMGAGLSPEELAQVSPWRFLAPVAPPLAARREGGPLEFEPVARFCEERVATSEADLLVAEGVGGLMSPLTEGATSLDLLQQLACPSVLVSGAYLGALSHALTALEVLRARGRPPAAILVSESADPGAPAFADSVELLAAHAGETPVLAVPRDGANDWADAVLSLVFPTADHD